MTRTLGQTAVTLLGANRSCKSKAERCYNEREARRYVARHTQAKRDTDKIAASLFTTLSFVERALND